MLYFREIPLIATTSPVVSPFLDEIGILHSKLKLTRNFPIQSQKLREIMQDFRQLCYRDFSVFWQYTLLFYIITISIIIIKVSLSRKNSFAAIGISSWERKCLALRYIFNAEKKYISTHTRFLLEFLCLRTLSYISRTPSRTLSLVHNVRMAIALN